MKTLFSILGIFFGALIDEGSGAVFGFFIGLLSGALIQQGKKIAALEKQLASRWSPGREAEQQAPATPPAEESKQPASAPAAQSRADEDDEEEEDDDITLMPLDGTGEYPTIPEPPEEDTLRPTPTDREKARAWTDADGGFPVDNPVTAFLHRFFTTGNVLVKIGILIVITGVAFLLKLAAEHGMFPVELRFIGVAILGMVIFAFGWRLREDKRNYALVLQGGAVGILYVTVFVATREQFALLPLGLAFALMLGLVVFSCMLAVLQDAKSLAVFATAGGFLAPVLTSTGSGNHVALFSYYAFLNAGIFAIAWHKAWRSLNWLGFIFTFVIASLWGYEYYQPEKFATTEPFLVLFFLFYVVIAILFAHRQPPNLKGLVDGSLVFGTPLVGFTLQAALVRDFAYGESISAVVLAAFYVLLARFLWRRPVAGMRLMCESFLALGIIFATVAIPFALDGRWTAAAWALEGAGIAWIGIRQNRMIARLFGLLLQIGGAVAFLAEVSTSRDALPVLNSAYIGMLLISISALFIGWQFYRYRDRLHAAGRDAHIALLIWGLVWWFAAGLMEIDYHVIARFEMNVSLFFIALSTWLLFISARALRWHTAEYVPVLLLPVMVIFAAVRFSNLPYLNPFGYFGYAAWIAAFVVQYGLLYRAENTWNEKLLGHWHALTMWLYVFMATWVIANAITLYVAGMHNWNDIFWGLLPTLGVYKLLYMRHKFPWPMRRFERSYLCEGMVPIVVYLAAWVVVNCFRTGDPAPVIYIPVINPQDIVQLLAMLAIGDWLLQLKKAEVPILPRFNPDHGLVALAGIAFLWLNSLVAQTIHFYMHVPHRLEPMLESGLFQTSISILWTLTALAVMVVATRREMRRTWFAGIVLLAAVVVKLVLVDLVDTGTITRIVSFLTVGILMLIIGYYSPIPPRENTSKKSA